MVTVVGQYCTLVIGCVTHDVLTEFNAYWNLGSGAVGAVYVNIPVQVTDGTTVPVTATLTLDTIEPVLSPALRTVGEDTDKTLEELVSVQLL